MPKKSMNIKIGKAHLIFAVLVSVAALCLYALGAIYLPTPPLALCASVLLMYLAAVLIFLLTYKEREKVSVNQDFDAVIDQVMADALLNFNIPAFICRKNGEILWYNYAAAELGSRKKFQNTTITAAFPAAQSSDPDAGDEGITVSSGDRIYRVISCNLTVSGLELTLVFMNDVSKLEKLYRTMAERELVASHIMVDNLEELLQHEQEEYRAAAAETQKLLREWASVSGGIIKEYQRDRYLFLFAASNLDDFTSRKFDILDRIREIQVGDGNIPVTVSIGVSTAGESLSEKEKTAQAALEMALQRGGDQVVVKYESTTEIYGGRTKSVQKRTKVRARVIAGELVYRMKNADNVLIMGHKYADFDSFAACVGIARLAMFAGAPVSIITDLSDANLDRCRSWLAGESEYEGVLVDSNRGLDLLKANSLLVIVDVNNKAMFEIPELADNCDNIVIIDHHRKTTEFEKEPLISYIEPYASAASELVSEMLEQVLPPNMLLPKEADLLLTGILLDTKQFTKNTGSRTFSAAMYLRDRGADVGRVQEFFKTNLDDFMRETKFRSKITVYRGIAAIAVGQGDGDQKDRIAAAKVADRLMNIEGVRASFALIRIGNTIHISARSEGSINVQLILEGLQGGGHFDSAGAQVEGLTLEDALIRLKVAIDKYLDS